LKFPQFKAKPGPDTTIAEDILSASKQGRSSLTKRAINLKAARLGVKKGMEAIPGFNLRFRNLKDLRPDSIREEFANWITINERNIAKKGVKSRTVFKTVKDAAKDLSKTVFDSKRTRDLAKGVESLSSKINVTFLDLSNVLKVTDQPESMQGLIELMESFSKVDKSKRTTKSVASLLKDMNKITNMAIDRIESTPGTIAHKESIRSIMKTLNEEAETLSTKITAEFEDVTEAIRPQIKGTPIKLTKVDYSDIKPLTRIHVQPITKRALKDLKADAILPRSVTHSLAVGVLPDKLPMSLDRRTRFMAPAIGSVSLEQLLEPTKANRQKTPLPMVTRGLVKQHQHFLLENMLANSREHHYKIYSKLPAFASELGMPDYNTNTVIDKIVDAYTDKFNLSTKDIKFAMDGENIQVQISGKKMIQSVLTKGLDADDAKIVTDNIAKATVNDYTINLPNFNGSIFIKDKQLHVGPN
jgi:hypothetical protein